MIKMAAQKQPRGLADRISELYKGFGIACIGIAIYRGLYFGLFDSLKPMLPTNRQDSLMANFVLGWGVTVGATLTAYPIDTVRRRMISSSQFGYSGSIDCAKKVLASEGFRSFFKGASANTSGLVGAGALTLYDRLQLVVFGKRLGSE
jgi:solute carrier family 25 (mitochondrial adenine nucleotide translocator), member 4/5/6/31